jgi:hypothetical protein
VRRGLSKYFPQSMDSRGQATCTKNCTDLLLTLTYSPKHCSCSTDSSLTSKVINLTFRLFSSSIIRLTIWDEPCRPSTPITTPTVVSGFILHLTSSSCLTFIIRSKSYRSINISFVYGLYWRYLWRGLAIMTPSIWNLPSQR